MGAQRFAPADFWFWPLKYVMMRLMLRLIDWAKQAVLLMLVGIIQSIWSTTEWERTASLFLKVFYWNICLWPSTRTWTSACSISWVLGPGLRLRTIPFSPLSLQLMGLLGLHNCMRYFLNIHLYIYTAMHHLTMEMLSKKYENLILMVEVILVSVLLSDLVCFSWPMSPPGLPFLSSFLRWWVSLWWHCSPGKNPWLVPVLRGCSYLCDIDHYSTTYSFQVLVHHSKVTVWPLFLCAL